MTKTSFLIIILFLTIQTFAQETFSVDAIMKEQKVKTRTQFECDQKGKNCEVIYQDHFDNKGRLTRNIQFSGGKPFMTSFYHYNKFNKADIFYIQFSGEKRYISQIFKFDNNGNITEYQSCFENSDCSTSEKYFYNSNNKLIKKIEFIDGKPNTKYEYFYDKKGNNIKETTQYPANHDELKELNYFDKNNRIIKSISYQNGKPFDSTIYSYDTNGNLTFLNWKAGYKSFYSYDRDGNKVKYLSFSQNNQKIDHRVMTYKNKLEQTRIHYIGKSIERFFKFNYQFY
ncbi:hypothetical protein [Flavobacterium sp. GCM10027622]|uniref:hypothetical protein n=1 Tax=unclassified Flavobacterium TaxID=196869 RepID=UPI00360DA589